MITGLCIVIFCLVVCIVALMIESNNNYNRWQTETDRHAKTVRHLKNTLLERDQGIIEIDHLCRENDTLKEILSNQQVPKNEKLCCGKD